MRFISVTLFACIFNFSPLYSQSVNCPPNIDFEAGTFSGWACSTGSTSAVGSTNTITLLPSAPTPGRHEIIGGPGTTGNDPYGNFPKLCPYGGQYSVKLGNDGTGGQAEGLSYTFQIPPSADTFSLTYFYAVVFEDPGHNDFEQPRFFVSAYDVLTGAVINCASYSYIATASIPGFAVSPVNSGVLYKDWTPVSIDFSGLAGRTVRLEFKTADCTLGGHFGYAYMDVGTGCGGVLAAGAYCVETNSVTLSAPYGFQTYSWYNSNYTTLVGNTRTVTMSPPPPVSSLFHVDMVPYPGYGCRDTADAQLTVLPVPDTPVAVSNKYYCSGDVASALSATPSTAHELLWYTNATGGVPSYTAPVPSTVSIGVFDFYVSQKTFFGCESLRKRIRVTVSRTPAVSFTVNNLQQCQNGNSFVFSSTSTNLDPAAVYLWDFGDGTAASTPVATHVYTTPGNHNVTLKVSNTIACSRQTSHTVTVIEKPVAVFSSPLIICENQTSIQLQDNSYVPGGGTPLTSWWWQTGASVITAQNPPSFTAPGGALVVKLVVATQQGCRSDTLIKNLVIHYSPVPAFSYGSVLCENEFVKFKDQSTMPPGSGSDVVAQWNWQYDNAPGSTLQNPEAHFIAGLHTVKLIAASNLGCYYSSADSLFVINPKPGVGLIISDSCVNRNILFTAVCTTSIPVSSWYWSFGNGGLQPGAAAKTKYFTQSENLTITLTGETVNRCRDTLIRPYTVYKNNSRAIRDTIVATDEPVQLETADTANVILWVWTPATGLSNTVISNPVATYPHDIGYELNTLTKQGCESKSRVFIRRYDGPEVYVPSAFTPNQDGRNDVLRAFPVGIRTFMYFNVYNRRGQQVFSTRDHHKGWDGTLAGQRQEAGNYVWVAMIIDYKGRQLMRKGNVLLLR